MKKTKRTKGKITSIRFDDEIYSNLEILSNFRNESIGETIRCAVDLLLEKELDTNNLFKLTLKMREISDDDISKILASVG